MNNELTQMNNSVALPAAPADMIECRMDAKRFPRLYTYSREAATFHMSKIVAKAFLYRGQQAEPNNIKFISSALVDELMEDNKYGARNISFAEISEIVKKAVLGGSEMYGISVASLYKIIMDWVKTEGTRLQKEAEKKAQLRRVQAINPVAQNMINAMANTMINNTK